MKAASVTVCIPCFEQADYLPEALASVNAQTLPPLEVIVIDDGSSATEAAKIRRIAEAHGARCIWQTNRGLPSARNTALMLAKGEGFVPLDSDDRLREDYLEQTMPLLSGHDVVLTGIQECGPPPRDQAYEPGFDRPYNVVGLETLWGYNRFFYAALFRTQTLREIGGYHSRMAGWPGVSGGFEDWDVWLDLLYRGARFTATMDPLLLYTTKKESMLMAAERNRVELVTEMRRHHAGR